MCFFDSFAVIGVGAAIVLAARHHQPDQWETFAYPPMDDWKTRSALHHGLFFTITFMNAEVIALLVDCVILGMTLYGCKPLQSTKHQDSNPRNALGPLDWFYTLFNRFVVLPAISLLVLETIRNAPQVLWNFDEYLFVDERIEIAANGWPWYSVRYWMLFAYHVIFMNSLNFALSDLVYYIGHRIVHANVWLYKIVHKHHHVRGGVTPDRGWVDTSNAHPLDFLYTGLSTIPISTMWLLPYKSVHIYGIFGQLILNQFVGSLGHSRVDIDVFGIFRTRFHAGHHALTKCNYAQNIEIWDRLFGTFREPSTIHMEEARAHKEDDTDQKKVK